MAEVVTLLEGEVHPSQHREFLSDREIGPLVLRGAAVTLYCLREMSQGERLYLDVQQYLEGKASDSKAHDHRFRRVGFQRKAPQNNFRRIIAAPIPAGEYCFESIKYATEQSSRLNLDVLLAFLNSQILDWYFRTTSSNAQVNEYQFNILPIPSLEGCGNLLNWESFLKPGSYKLLATQLCTEIQDPGALPQNVASAIGAMSRCIQSIESNRLLRSRSDRSHLAPESQEIQEAIDMVVFRSYGLTEADALYVVARLQDML
jgi:hypothetical protein